MSFFWSALTMVILFVCILVISRNQLHQEVLDSEARFLKTIFEKNLEEAYLQNLESEILLQETELYSNYFLELVPLLNQSAVASLNIPHIQGVQAYDHAHEPFNLPTATSNFSPAPLDFSNAELEGWSFRVLPNLSLSILVPIFFEEQLLFVEFSLLAQTFANSWKEIDYTLSKLGLFLGLTMLLILWIIFRVMIRKISAKEKLLSERTQVLQKTNEELSRAYKTTSLGAMTGHLMHGLRGQLTNLQNLVSSDNHAHQQIRKIQELVQQSLGSIKEAADDKINYSLSIEELFEIAREKFNQFSPETSFNISSNDCLAENINNLQANLALAILNNLFNNSADSRQAVVISLICQKRGSFLDLDISDNGTGIQPEIINRLFQPVVSRKKEGSGIGLALSRQLAESMGGSLTLLHTNPTGTAFRLSIPVIM